MRHPTDRQEEALFNFIWENANHFPLSADKLKELHDYAYCLASAIQWAQLEKELQDNKKQL